jgi:hypothetical protein
LDLTDNDFQQNYDHPDTIYAYGELTPIARHLDIHYQNQRQNQPDVEQLSPNLGFVPSLCIQHTLENTTQFAWLVTRLPLRQHFKSRFPAANVGRLNEVVATDTYFSDTAALDVGLLGHGGKTMGQLFCGCQSLITDVYPMRRESNNSDTVKDFIRQNDIPNSLFSNNAKSQIGKAIHEILHMYKIKDIQCEPHH